MYLHRLTDSRAFDIAQAMLDGFNRHDRLFSETNRAAKQRFEQADWHGQQRAQRERIEICDTRVDEAVERLQREFDTAHLADDTWPQVKLHDIGLLVDHHQPELVETFFNAVTTKILHHRYFRNDFIFVRPAVSPSTLKTTSRPRCRPTAPTARPRTACATPCCASWATFSCNARSRTWAATSTRCWPPCSAMSAAACGFAPTSRSRCCPREELWRHPPRQGGVL